MVRNKKEIAGIMIFSAWIIASWHLFYGEIKGLDTLPELLGKTYGERKAQIDGPVYGFIAKAEELIPPGSRVYFVNPSENSPASYFFMKSRYSLYPRRLHDARYSVEAKDILKNDYAAIYLPRESAKQYVLAYELSSLPFLELLREWKDEESYYAIYSVKAGK